MKCKRKSSYLWPCWYKEANRDRCAVLLFGRRFINDVLERYDTFGNRDIEVGTKVCCDIKRHITL